MRHGRRPLQVLALAGAALALVPAAASATTNVCATGETDPTHHVGDSADDAAIWINPANPAASTVIGTDKEVGGGLDVYDLAGHEKFVYPDDRVNNVDLRYNFPLGNQRVTLVGATNRVTRKADFWTVDETDGSLHRIASIDFSPAIAVGRGFALYHSPVSGKYYAFVTNFGNTDQYELDGSSGTLTGKLVRQWSVANPNTEGLVADDERGLVYLAEENVGRIGRYGAEPTDPTTSATVDTTTEVGGHIVQDIKGLAIIYGRGGAGYLLAISQGGNTFHVYDRAGANAYRGEFAIGDCSATTDKVTGMDGIDATNVNLGPAFPDGLFVTQDTQNPGTNQNFKLVPWGAIARPMGLTIDTGFNPRDIGALGSPTPLPTPTPIPDPVPDPTPGPHRVRRPGRRRPGPPRPPRRTARARRRASTSSPRSRRGSPPWGASALAPASTRSSPRAPGSGSRRRGPSA